jgi:tetrahydrodipicolinate N-succinyltransferase
MKIDENLSTVFGISPMIKDIEGEIIVSAEETVERVSIINAVDDDFNKTRDNLYKLLKSGQDALNDAMNVARQSEHPRAYEVVGNLMKQLADINEQILNLHAKKQKIMTPREEKKEDAKQVTNNAIFVGSTSDLSKLIQNMKGE